MNNKHRFISIIVSLLAIAGLLASCGGGGGGGGSSALATGTFTKTIAVGALSSAFGYPFGSGATGTRNMFMLLASDIKGSGNVRSLRFRYQTDVATAYSCPNVTIKLGATTLSALSATYDNNVNQGAGSFTTVLNDAAVTIPAGTSGEYFNIELATPFEYNGKDNLVVEQTRTSACAGDVNIGATTVAYNATVLVGVGGTSTTVTGTAYTSSAFMQLVFAGGDNKLPLGTYQLASPFYSSPFKFQSLYLASEINGSGPVTGIALQTSGATFGTNTYTYTLKLGHSQLAVLGTNYADNYSDSPVTVANGVTFTIPNGLPDGDWFWIPIPDGVFNYNGTDNLIVEISTTASSGQVTYVRELPTANRGVFVNDPAATDGTAENAALNITLRFNGGRVNVLTDSTTADGGLIFSTTANGVASLFRASELGTGGTITSIACRSFTDSVVGNYPSFKIVIGHATVDRLTAVSSATDFVSQQVAYSGNLMIPATLKKGDWIDIPLSAPFAYDGKRNLIIWQGSTASDGSIFGNNCSFSSFDTVRYPGHMADGVPGDRFSSTAPKKEDISLTIAK